MFKKKKSQNNSAMTLLEQRNILGNRLNFGAAEAYKLLRTNLEFSLPKSDGSHCPVIGITSSLRGEGKSTTAINTAYTIAQSGKKVLLIDSDLRLPSIAKRLGVSIKPGLSNMLVGQCRGEDAAQQSPLLENFFVLTAGDIPPNPSELLGSAQMLQILQNLSAHYDYIVLDLPPLAVVSDALVVSKFIDGMVMVVRQNYCTRRDLAECMRQLNFSGAKILGFVMTHKDIRKKAYGKYGKKYNGGYNYGYGSTEDGRLNALQNQKGGRASKKPVHAGK